MKPLVIFNECRNEYLTRVYLSALTDYAQATGKYIAPIEDIDQVSNSVVLCHADFLTTARINRLKNNSCNIVAFDINDSSNPNESYQQAKEMYFIDLIFKVSGIQKTNFSTELSVDKDFNFSTVQERFLSDEMWDIYNAMHTEGRIQSLPYVPWNNPEAPYRPFHQRSGKVLFRGGCQLYRFLTFLNMVKLGMVDENSSFATGEYFKEGMTPRFRFCKTCRMERQQGGGIQPWTNLVQDTQCSSPAEWGERCNLETRYTANLWNNQCPKSFMWLTEQFEKRHGELDHSLVQMALNGNYEDERVFMDSLSRATFYADFKWIFSVYAPPRFWEAANARTVNYLPRRTKDQEHFPKIEEGEHYLAFEEDFSDGVPKVSEGDYLRITENARGLYEHWIKPTGKRSISDNLSQHILDTIERTCG